MSWYLLLAAVAAGSATAATTFEEAHVPTEEADKIAMGEERYERLTVPVTIMGQGPFRFMIDTGAQATVLSTILADHLKLHDRRDAILVGMASRRPVEVAEVPEFSLGTRTINIQNAPLLERANIGGADGIVGLDSLQGQRVLLDFDKNEMHVADARELGGNRGYEIVVKARPRLGQLIITNAKLNGVPVQVLIDTGAQGSVGNHALLARLRHTRDMGETTMTDVNGITLSGTSRQTRALSFGRMEINNLPVVFADSPSFRALDLHDQPALVLGVRELRMFKRVAIDFEQRKILFDLPTDPHAPIGNHHYL
ncbi:aspartyl protease family protein [Tsuneonella sp. HG222]